MPRPTLYLAITNHGFGHAVRACSVAAAVQQRCPDVLLILGTTAPRWLLESYIPGDFIYRPRALDVGVIQQDSLKMDEAATLEKLRQLRSQERSLIASEVNYLKTNRVDLILGDIPPLAGPIAHAAGIPCWMMSNFGWDFIYRPWGGEFVAIADWIAECYQKCDRLFRLPMCEPMVAFSQVTDVGLTGGTPRYSQEEMRQLFKLSARREQRIILTFGGLGLEAIPYHNLQQFPEWEFITFDRHAPDLPNLLKIVDSHYRPVDFFPLCDRLISKPGFSTFSEAMRQGVPIVSLTRQGFAETPLLLEGIANYAHHQIISPEAFFQGDWDFLRQPPQPPQQGDLLAKDGTEVIAKAIVEYFSGK
jgi:hypothetical protein